MEDRQPVVIDRTGRDIHAEGSRIAEQGPVAQVELPGGVIAWSITGYEAATQALSDPRFSKDPRRHWPAYIQGKVGADFPLIGWVLMENLTTAYGTDHSRLRRLTSTAFTPRRVEAMRPNVEKVVGALLDELAAGAPGVAVDLKATFARPLPAQVICDLFGVPDDEREQMLRGGEANVDTTSTAEEAAANVEQWHREMLAFVDTKRRVPGDDLTTALTVAQEEDGSRLTDTELVGTLHLMLATGTEPVMNLITNTVRELLAHPDQLKLVMTGQVSWDDVISEALRVEAPVAHLPFRFATTDIEIGGVTIAEGDPILINFAAAGRDPAVHGDSAGTFDISRPDKEHLSFGSGIYRCIGKPLALLEATVALPALFARFPDMSLAANPRQLEPEGTFIMNGVRALPVHLHTARS